jgi:hypothetical protein
MPVSIRNTDIRIKGIQASVTLPTDKGFVSCTSSLAGIPLMSAAAPAACGSTIPVS